MPLKEQIEASLVEVKKSSVKCPGEKCGYRIQKTSGCDHMTCKFVLLESRSDKDCANINNRLSPPP
jgi:hypothetical protein